MKSIRIENVSKRFGQEIIFENLSLEIPSGKFFALLGPSGCGKSTLLRLIGGFESVDSGSIYLGDKNITNVPINKREINTVFQRYALFPHMNVFQNVAYSQVIKGLSRSKIEEKVLKILDTVGLKEYMYKSIDQISGGQQQRVALARAVINDPEVLLLDEPLAALDVKLREKMLVELIEIQENLGTTFVYVTHDQVEALTVADSVAILNKKYTLLQAQIEQIGSPKSIYEFPKTSFVANFVGTTNIFEGKLICDSSDPAKLFVDIPFLGKIELDSSKLKFKVEVGCKIMAGIRPEKILVSKKPEKGFSNSISGAVESIVYHGRSTQYEVLIKEAGFKIKVFEQNEEHFFSEVIDYDDEVCLYWQKENVMFFPS